MASDKAHLNIKSTVGMTCTEFEYPIPVVDAETMRTPYAVAFGGKKPDIGLHGAHEWKSMSLKGRIRALIVAELGLPAPDEVFERPVAWVGLEVTDDKLIQCSSTPPISE